LTESYPSGRLELINAPAGTTSRQLRYWRSWGALTVASAAYGGGSMRPLRIYLETGKRWVFACALDWPGWSRRDKGEGAAIEILLAYSERYAKAVCVAVPTGSVDVVGRVATRSGMGGLRSAGRGRAVGRRTSAQPDSAWPVRYTIRRLAWHILDHAWEMEDRAR
jgi:hypothetical protein